MIDLAPDPSRMVDPRPPCHGEHRLMGTMLGPASAGRYCDGIPRRNFLRAGALGLGGLTLPTLLQAEARAPRPPRPRSVIMVYLTWGIAHQDTFDLKPHAPAEVRGEFQPVATNVPGIEISERLPKLAQLADKYALVRSIVGLVDEHSSFQNVTGFQMGQAQREGKPSFGSVVSRVQGSTDRVTPPFVDLFPTMQHRPYNSPGPGYLGRAHGGVRADGEDLASMKLRYVEPPQFQQRRQLLQAFDGFRRQVDDLHVGGMDSIYQRAFDVLTSSKLVEALDLDKEDPRIRALYGKGSPKHLGDGAPLWNEQLLMARRLVEAGVRCVTVAYGFWDTHGNNFGYLKQHLPTFDQGIAALVQDVAERGLSDSVTIVVWGEFGRTPKINKEAGRDHWPRVSCCLLAGGGMRTGQVIGSSDKIADSAATRPVHYLDVLATIYHNLGIDTHNLVRDMAERPVPILPEAARVIHELV